MSDNGSVIPFRGGELNVTLADLGKGARLRKLGVALGDLDSPALIDGYLQAQNLEYLRANPDVLAMLRKRSAEKEAK